MKYTLESLLADMKNFSENLDEEERIAAVNDVLKAITEEFTKENDVIEAITQDLKDEVVKKTKVSVFSKKELKKIEIFRFLNIDGRTQPLGVQSINPDIWDNVQLLRKGSVPNNDQILAWNNDLDEGNYPVVYLGNWNDGII
jgi:hypothetical protein